MLLFNLRYLVWTYSDGQSACACASLLLLCTDKSYSARFRMELVRGALFNQAELSPFRKQDARCAVCIKTRENQPGSVVSMR
jgi:hypothetical protein